MSAVEHYKSDNYFTYDIHRHLNTDFHQILPNKDEHVFACCFRIVKSTPEKIIKYPFLEYLLYKYPQQSKHVSNLCIFPFRKYHKKKILEMGKEMVKEIFGTLFTCIGYIRNKNGIYLFYNIDFDLYNVDSLKTDTDMWWTLIDEICNFKKILNFPIHDSVSKLFYTNPKLIYLKDKEKKCIEIPSVAYFGDSYEILQYISTFGIRSSIIRPYGPYYYFNNYTAAIRNGAWTSSFQKRRIFGKSIADSNGKYIRGGIVRFALFLGKNRHILYRKTGFQENPDAKMDEKNYHSIKNLDKHTFIDESKIGKTKGKWTKKYDSLIIGRIKFKNLSGYFNYNTYYVVKDFAQFTSLSNHIIDKNSLKANWDPAYDDYQIK